MVSRRATSSSSSRRTRESQPTDQLGQTQVADSLSDTHGEIGEPPGSPAYFGEVGNAERARADSEVSSTGPGHPTGSPAYYGGSEPPETGVGDPSGIDLPLPTVGEPPGSAAYFGETKTPERTGSESPGDPPGSAAYYGASAQVDAGIDEPVSTARSLPTVGEPPGSKSYYGAS
jgi:hypothetical protein